MRKTTRLKKPQIPELDTLYRFDDLGGRPKYGGVEMTSATDIPSFEEIQRHVDGAITAEAAARGAADDDLAEDIARLVGSLGNEVADRLAADNRLQNEIDTIVASSDVKDLVGTYADLQAYDTSTLGDNDIIKVLQDETHQNEMTYYRWILADEQFSLIGEEGPYYTKAATDALLAEKQDELTAGENITINGNVISAYGGIFLVRASETTSQSRTPEGSDLQDYAGKTGLYVSDVYSDPSTPGFGNIYYVYSIGVDPETEDPYAEYVLIANMQEAWAAIASIGNMMPLLGFGAPSSSTAGQAGQLYIDAQNYVLYLCIDESNPYVWQQLDRGPTVVQTTGNSQADVMSQNATTSMVFADPGTNQKIQIGSNSNAAGIEATTVGYHSYANNWGTAIGTGSRAGGESIGVGRGAIASGVYSIAIGSGARVENVSNSVAIGAAARATRRGEVNVGTGAETWGYNNTKYCVIGGVHDPVDVHDAATKGYVDVLVGNVAAALNAINNGGGN